MKKKIKAVTRKVTEWLRDIDRDWVKDTLVPCIYSTLALIVSIIVLILK